MVLATKPSLQPPQLNFNSVIRSGIPELKTPQRQARMLVSGGTNCQQSLNLSYLYKLPEPPAFPMVDSCAQASWCLPMAPQDSDRRVVEGFLYGLPGRPLPCQGALSQATWAAACRNTNWEVRQRSGFNELPCCNSNSLVLFTDTLLMRCLSEGKLGWGRRGRASSSEGKRKTPTSTEAFTAAGPQPMYCWGSPCMQVMGVQPRCLPQ